MSKTKPKKEGQEIQAPDIRKNAFLGALSSFFNNLIHSVSAQERINFARHLSVAIKSGLPLLEALRLIGRQSSSKYFSKVVNGIIEDINNGELLAQSLNKHEHIFGDFFINMVRVGETSGNLSQSLLYLAQELKKQREINHRVRSALIYPAIILFATVGITIFLTVFIFPKILPIFVSLRVELPASTKFIIALLTFVQQYGYYAVLGFILLVILIKFVLSLKKVHFYFDKFLLSVPFLSTTIINLTMTDFTRSLSVLLKSGMTIIDSLEISKGTFHNLYYRYHIDQIIEGVKRGETMARHLAEEPRLFPPMFTGMVQIGENTGNLEGNLFYLSEYYESEVDDVIKNITAIIEPMLLLIMGLVVGFVAISIITPIYKITQGIQIK